ncbi:putative leader peptide [Streptomyces alkaliterrae]|nr:putative leader peptide [Streptomyces alkaliterrae]
MVMHDVSHASTVGEGAPGGALLVARLHVDLCRLSSAMC